MAVNKFSIGASVCFKATAFLLCLTATAHSQNNTLRSKALGNQTVTAKLFDKPLGCHPGPDEVAFFEHKDFGGRCFLSSKGPVFILGSGARDWHGVSSVRVGSNIQVVLCSKKRFMGDCTLTDHDIAYLGQVAVGNDRLASFYVRGPVSCVPTGNQVAVYSGVAFSGACTTLSPGEYPDKSNFDLFDGIASVLQNAPRPNGGVMLCSKKKYKGRCVKIMAPADASLQDDKVGIGNTSSIKAYPLPPKCSGSILPLRPTSLPVTFIRASAGYQYCEGYDSVVLTIRQDRPFWFDKTLVKAVKPISPEQELLPADNLEKTYQCESGTYEIKIYAKLRAHKGTKTKDLAETHHEVILCGVPPPL